MRVQLYSTNFVMGIIMINALLVLLSICSIYLSSDKINDLTERLRATQEALRHFGILVEQTEKENASLQEIKKQQERKEKAVVSYIMTQNPHIREDEARTIAKLHIAASGKYAVPLAIGLGVNRKESVFDAKAVSYNQTSYGLMQIHYSAHKDEYNISSRARLFDKAFNVEVGYKMLSEHYKKYGSYEKALKRYYGASDPYENQEYAVSVLTYSSKISKLLSQV